MHGRTNTHAHGKTGTRTHDHKRTNAHKRASSNRHGNNNTQAHGSKVTNKHVNTRALPHRRTGPEKVITRLNRRSLLRLVSARLRVLIVRFCANYILSTVPSHIHRFRWLATVTKSYLASKIFDKSSKIISGLFI